MALGVAVLAAEGLLVALLEGVAVLVAELLVVALLEGVREMEDVTLALRVEDAVMEPVVEAVAVLVAEAVAVAEGGTLHARKLSKASVVTPLATVAKPTVSSCAPLKGTV